MMTDITDELRSLVVDLANKSLLGCCICGKLATREAVIEKGAATGYGPFFCDNHDLKDAERFNKYPTDLGFIEVRNATLVERVKALGLGTCMGIGY